MSVVSLQDLAGIAPAKKHYPEAEYEFMISAIDPDQTNVDPDHPDFQFLNPPDVIEQFHGISVEQAMEFCEKAVDYVLAGHIAPDQDYRTAWKQLVKTTIEHLTTGHGGWN